MSSYQDQARLAVGRHAARLFLEKGVGSTSGEDIAAAAGISTRTVWRYFRTKEACVEPLFAKSSIQFAAQLRQWPSGFAIEEYLASCIAFFAQTQEDLADGMLVVRLLARMPREPDLQAAWLAACHTGEQKMAEAIAHRLGRSAGDYEVRLCAATVTAAMRVVDETISIAAIEHGQVFTLPEIARRLAHAIREASTIDFCDPVIPNVFGDAPVSDKGISP